MKKPNVQQSRAPGPKTYKAPKIPKIPKIFPEDIFDLPPIPQWISRDDEIDWLSEQLYSLSPPIGHPTQDEDHDGQIDQYRTRLTELKGDKPIGA